MGDEIKRAVVKDETLHLVRGEDVWSVKAEQGKEPNEWKMVHFANVGTSEEFIETFSGEILELVDGSLIFGEERESVKNAITTIVVEGLMPAFEHLKKIRASVATPLPELNRRQLYEDFARSLWHAYKDLFPKATLFLGFDIGFLFKQDAQFSPRRAKFICSARTLGLAFAFCPRLSESSTLSLLSMWFAASKVSWPGSTRMDGWTGIYLRTAAKSQLWRIPVTASACSSSKADGLASSIPSRLRRAFKKPLGPKMEIDFSLPCSLPPRGAVCLRWIPTVTRTCCWRTPAGLVPYFHPLTENTSPSQPPSMSPMSRCSSISESARATLNC
jgi:hypothetical protein